MSTSHKGLVIAMAAVAVAVLSSVGGMSTATADTVTTAPPLGSAAGGPPSALIVFDRWNLANQSGDLRVGDPLGLGSRALTAPPSGSLDSHPVRSPSGREVVFMRESESGVSIGVIAVPSGGEPRWIDTGCGAVPDCAADLGPTWSHDGKRILFTRVMGPFDEATGDAASAALYSTKLDGRDLRLVGKAPTPGVEDTGARFTPDGRYMIFIRDARIGGALKFAIFRMRADGTHEQQLTPWDLNADRPAPSPAASGPTAGMIAFETFGGAEPGRGDIAMLPYLCESLAACVAATRYVTHNGGGRKSSFAATWSPDGRLLAFAEEPDTSGKVNVWTSLWNGALRHQLTKDDHSFSPSWG